MSYKEFLEKHYELTAPCLEAVSIHISERNYGKASDELNSSLRLIALLRDREAAQVAGND